MMAGTITAAPKTNTIIHNNVGSAVRGRTPKISGSITR